MAWFEVAAFGGSHWGVEPVLRGWGRNRHSSAGNPVPI